LRELLLLLGHHILVLALEMLVLESVQVLLLLLMLHLELLDLLPLMLPLCIYCTLRRKLGFQLL
jgi:hypothetical protein